MQSKLYSSNFVLLSEIITFIQTPEEHWLLRVPDLSAIYPHCDAILGVILDQPWSHQCQGGSRSVITLYKHCGLCLESPVLDTSLSKVWLAVVTQISLLPRLTAWLAASQWSSCGFYYVLLCLFCLIRPHRAPWLWMDPVCGSLARPLGAKFSLGKLANKYSAILLLWILSKLSKLLWLQPLFFDHSIVRAWPESPSEVVRLEREETVNRINDHSIPRPAPNPFSDYNNNCSDRASLVIASWTREVSPHRERRPNNCQLEEEINHIWIYARAKIDMG